MVCVTMKMCSSTMHPQIICPKLLRAMKKPKSSSELTKLFVGKHFPISKLNWQMEPPRAAEQEPCHSQPLTSTPSAVANVGVQTDLQSWQVGRSWWQEPSSPGPAHWAGERGKNKTRNPQINWAHGQTPAKSEHNPEHLNNSMMQKAFLEPEPCICWEIFKGIRCKTDTPWTETHTEQRRGQEGGKDRRADNHVWKPCFHFQLSSPCILNLKKMQSANPNSLPHMEGHQIHRTVDSSSTHSGRSS